jgi:hypothetical protein
LVLDRKAEATKMARKPRRLSIWSRTPQSVKIVGYIGTIAGAIYAMSQAAPVAEPYIPAWHEWVREHVNSEINPLRLTQNQQAIGMDRFLLYNLKKDIDAAHKDPAAVTSPTAQERIEDLKRQQQETEERIRKATGGR